MCSSMKYFWSFDIPQHLAGKSKYYVQMETLISNKTHTIKIKCRACIYVVVYALGPCVLLRFLNATESKQLVLNTMFRTLNNTEESQVVSCCDTHPFDGHYIGCFVFLARQWSSITPVIDNTVTLHNHYLKILFCNDYAGNVCYLQPLISDV